MAIHTYHDNFEVCPPGTIPNNQLPPERRLSWLTAILPYMDQDTLWKRRVDVSQAWDTAGHQPLVNSPVPYYICPSDPHSQAKDGEKGLTTYVGIAGVGTDAAQLPRTHERAGFFGYDREITLKDVEDGLSNTLVVIEMASISGPWAAGGPATTRGLNPAEQPYISEDGPFGRVHRRPDSWQFASLRYDPLVVVADGSVRSIQASMSAQTLEAVCTIRGRDQYGPDW